MSKPSINNNQFEKQLEPLLKLHFNDENLKVISSTTTNLLAPGENYCSEMLRLDVTIRKANKSDEHLHLVAKTNVSHRDKEAVVSWPRALAKELFVYAELLPIYCEIERQAGLDDLIDILPRYFGHVNSSRGNNVIDDHSVLLMENLRCRGYYTIDKRVGLNFQQASAALSSLARYHALSTATKRKRPSNFARALDHAHLNPFDPSARVKTIEPIRKLFRACPRLQRYADRLDSSLADYDRLKNTRTLEPREPWVSINHGDFHASNVMFREDARGRVDDAKIVDFQTYFCSSPLVDLPLFLCLYLDDESHCAIDELLDVYRENYVASLERIGCDARCITREAFDRELREQARIVFSRIAVVVLVSTFQIDKEDKLSRELLDEVAEVESSAEIETNMIRLVEVYERRGWFGLD